MYTWHALLLLTHGLVGKPVSIPDRGRGHAFPDHALRSLFREVLAEEREHLTPCVHRLLGAVERPVPVIEPVAGAVVAMELVGLAVLLQRGLVLVHLLGARRAVVVA